MDSTRVFGTRRKGSNPFGSTRHTQKERALPACVFFMPKTLQNRSFLSDFGLVTLFVVYPPIPMGIER